MTTKPRNRDFSIPGLLIALLLISGAFTADKAQAISTCANMGISQDGAELTAKNGIFRIKRGPFTVRYKGPGRTPSITLSLSPQLNSQLENYGRELLLASAGDYMALSPEDIILLDEFSLYDNHAARKTFAELLGDNYPELVQKLVEQDPGLELATSISKASSGFSPNPEKKSQDYRISSINGRPMQKTDFSRLYLTYFGVMSDMAPPSEQETGMALLQIVSWGSCTIIIK